MPSITSITPIDDERLAIDIDGTHCCSVRKRTFAGMDLSIGSEISCEKLEEQEKNYWKYAYADLWETEGYRIERVIGMIEWADDRVETMIVGFGADQPEFIDSHSDTPGFPDLAVYLRGGGPLVARIEVSGTDKLREGSAYWVRPDKVKYAVDHPDEHVWIALHYQEPKQRVACIKPTNFKADREVRPTIRGAIERYIEFYDRDPEVVDHNGFKQWLNSRVDQLLEGQDQP